MPVARHRAWTGSHPAAPGGREDPQAAPEGRSGPFVTRLAVRKQRGLRINRGGHWDAEALFQHPKHQVGWIPIRSEHLLCRDPVVFGLGLVKAIRRAYQIDSLYDHLRKQGWLTTKETAAQLEIHCQTAKNYAIAGVLEARRVNDKDEILFAPITGPLPKVQQGKRLRDRRRYPPCASKRKNEVQYAG